MKILVTDFLNVNEHKNMNINLIKSLANNNELIVINFGNYYTNEELNLENVILINQKNKYYKNKILKGFNIIKLMRKSKKIYKKYKCDLLISLAFDTVGYFLGMCLFKNVKVALFYHKNIDELKIIKKQKLFNCYKDKVYHLVFENYFKKYLIEEINVNANKIFVIPHPISDQNFQKDYQAKIDCISLCNSSSNEIIKALILSNDLFKKNNLNIVIRSKEKIESYSNISVINGFLDDITYNNLLNISKSILVLLPKTYIYRLSGSIYDGLSRGKIVLTTSRIHYLEIEKKYPGICFYVETIDDIINVLKKLKTYTISNESFKMFIEDHSIKKVSEELKEALKIIFES